MLKKQLSKVEKEAKNNKSLELSISKFKAECPECFDSSVLHKGLTFENFDKNISKAVDAIIKEISKGE